MRSNIDTGDVIIWKYHLFLIHIIICVHCWLCYGTLSKRFAESCRPAIMCTRLVPDIGHNPFEVEGILQYARLISLPKTPATASFRNGSSQQCLAVSHINITASLGLCQTCGRQPFTRRNSAVRSAVDKLIFGRSWRPAFVLLFFWTRPSGVLTPPCLQLACPPKA